MKITLCGSIAFYTEMLDVKSRLEKAGHEVKLPPIKVKGRDGSLIPVEEYYKIRKEAGDDDGWVWDRKAEAMMLHFEKEEWADVILVTNFDKKGVAGYVGGNTLMEMGVAFFLGKKIFMLNPIPDLSYKEEILGMKPVVINGDLTKVVKDKKKSLGKSVL